MDKNTKILILEIFGEWNERLQSGNSNIWNHALHGKPHRSGLPEVRLNPPEIGCLAALNAMASVNAGATSFATITTLSRPE